MYVLASALGALCLLKCTRTLIFHFVVNVNDQSVYYIYSSFYLLFANSFSFSCIGCIVYFRNFAECLLIFMICLFLFERFDCVCHTQWFEYIQQIVSFFLFCVGWRLNTVYLWLLIIFKGNFEVRIYHSWKRKQND